jgi:hypothetical protein
VASAVYALVGFICNKASDKVTVLLPSCSSPDRTVTSERCAPHSSTKLQLLHMLLFKNYTFLHVRNCSSPGHTVLNMFRLTCFIVQLMFWYPNDMNEFSSSPGRTVTSVRCAPRSHLTHPSAWATWAPASSSSSNVSKYTFRTAPVSSTSLVNHAPNVREAAHNSNRSVDVHRQHCNGVAVVGLCICHETLRKVLQPETQSKPHGLTW